MTDNSVHCPQCHFNNFLQFSKKIIKCNNCGREYLIKNGIANFFISNQWDDSKSDVTEEVKKFYTKNPFPGYENFEGINSLISKANEGIYAKLLNDQIPFNTNILEIGCGTGQLSNYLGLASRNVIGTDMCLKSLEIAEAFRKKNGINNTQFYQMNLFNPIFSPNSFHFVICQGVLHHTSDPYLGFQAIAKMVKKNGYIVLGLYNKYGRLITDFRRKLFNFSGDRFKSIDPRLGKMDRGKLKRSSWFNDQYKHPHESKHTIGEILKWFEKNNFDFINSIPKINPFSITTKNELLFNRNSKGNFVERGITQFKSILNGYREGGLFIIIGKKRN